MQKYFKVCVQGYSLQRVVAENENNLSAVWERTVSSWHSHIMESGAGRQKNEVDPGMSIQKKFKIC